MGPGSDRGCADCGHAVVLHAPLEHGIERLHELIALRTVGTHPREGGACEHAYRVYRDPRQLGVRAVDGDEQGLLGLDGLGEAGRVSRDEAAALLVAAVYEGEPDFTAQRAIELGIDDELDQVVAELDDVDAPARAVALDLDAVLTGRRAIEPEGRDAKVAAVDVGGTALLGRALHAESADVHAAELVVCLGQHTNDARRVEHLARGDVRHEPATAHGLGEGVAPLIASERIANQGEAGVEHVTRSLGFTVQALERALGPLQHLLHAALSCGAAPEGDMLEGGAGLVGQHVQVGNVR